MAITRVKLSGSTNGRGVSLATLPTTIHTSTTAAGASDEIHVWFVNNTGATATVALFMGTTGASDGFNYELPHNNLSLVVPGLFLTSGLVLSAHGFGSGLAAYGFVNRLMTGA